MNDEAATAAAHPHGRPVAVDAAADDGPARGWFAPALGPMLRERRLAVAAAVVGAVQVAAGVFHFKTFACPMLHATGVPCPGCGASRASGALLRGDWAGYLTFHAMAPCFLGAVGLFALAAALPRRQRDALAHRLDRLEARTGIVKLLLLLLFLYWGARLLYAPAEFARLVRG
jgi:hypothetical protein